MTEDKKMPETWLEAMRGEPDQRRLVGLPRPPTLEEALRRRALAALLGEVKP